MPDFFIPIDTVGMTNYLMEIRNSGLIYTYSLEYSDNQRKDLSRFANYKDIIKFLNQKKVFEQFIEYASINKIPLNQKELNISKNILKTQLYAYIIRNILDNDGFYPVIEDIDNTLLRAAKELEKYSIIN
jgi:carboxyl-terminal processing protease